MASLVLPSLMQNFLEAEPHPNGFASSMMKRLRQNRRPGKGYTIGPLFVLFRRYRCWMRKHYADLNGYGQFYD